MVTLRTLFGVILLVGDEGFLKEHRNCIVFKDHSHKDIENKITMHRLLGNMLKKCRKNGLETNRNILLKFMTSVIILDRRGFKYGDYRLKYLYYLSWSS